MEPGRRVLILDDDPMVGLLMETVARLDGAATRLTDRAEFFFAALDDWPPTHIVLDLNLAERSGELVLEQLAGRGCTARIVISSGAEPERLARAMALGRDSGLTMAGLLSKPFLPGTLRGLLA